MSKCLDLAAAAGALALLAAPALADGLGLGRLATPDEVAAWDIDVRPDGLGLPVGSGDVESGEEVFADKCAVCHGDFGEGVGRWPVLAGGEGTLASDDPVKTVGSYWPYLSTAWDYVHRAMPFGDAQSLTDDEVYAIVAYILYSNDIVDDEFVLSNKTFLDVEMPNADGFFPDDRADSPIFARRDVCMEACKDDVVITARARIVDVTPDEDSGVSDAAESEGADDAAPVETAAASPAPDVTAAAAIDADLAKKGEKVFRKCKACHQLGDGAKNRTGPILTGVVGAPVGAIDGFKYSRVFKTLAEDGVVWSNDELHAFLEKPKAWAKGTKMSFAGLKREADRDAVIEYLRAAGSPK
ncbi:MAG: c-type cytochrome [Pseudomonadota bacterium]